jgi:hypothetical protein
MPESVTDRPTNSWEPIFLLAKSQTYFMDMIAVQEPVADCSIERAKYSFDASKDRNNTARGGAETFEASKLVPESGMRNQRNVWTLGPEPYSEAHFATFPTEIPRRAILAGTSARGCCPKCYAPWERQVDKTRLARHELDKDDERYRPNRYKGKHEAIKGNMGEDAGYTETRTVGWEPGCECDGVDRRIVASPTGGRNGDDPSLVTGRAGMNRPRGDNEGQRQITRYEQAQYAAQLKASTHRKEMEAEAGSAFAHYIRTDDNGARPIPDKLLAGWLEHNWLVRVDVPGAVTGFAPIPCTVLDPFGGSGTTGAVALELGRHAILCELNEEYLKLIETRTNVTGGLQLA